MKSEVSLQKRIFFKNTELFLVASNNGLTHAFWSEQKGIPFQTETSQGSQAAKILNQAESELAQYLSGQRKQFEVKLLVKGTPFQERVWAELKKIPYGATRSYKQVAEAIGTNATRAVGSANAKNPVCLFVPCHRVIASSGELGGFSGGLEMKSFLLNLESSQ